MARSLTVILLLLQSTTHCRYQVYTKFLLTYTAIYQGNRKVLPLGIMALQPQTHFHLGTPHRTTQITTIVEECGPCLAFVSLTLVWRVIEFRCVCCELLSKDRKWVAA